MSELPRLQAPFRIGGVRLAWLDRYHSHSRGEHTVQLCKQGSDGAIAWTVGSENKSLLRQSCLIAFSLQLETLFTLEVL